MNEILDFRQASIDKEDELISSRQILQMTPPRPKLSIITQTGDVIVQFDKRMRVLPDLEMIKGVVE